MNLYRILVTHVAPKDRHESIQTYLITENEGMVYDYIDKNLNYSGWKDQEENQVLSREEDPEEYINFPQDDPDFREYIISVKGEMFSEHLDYGDAYYGLTYYGWELIESNIEVTDYQFQFMIDFDIAQVYRGVGLGEEL